ncbi:Cobalamin-independent synthase, Catalytic domain [Pseudonocardia thermophila]|uniref:Cobalamin-independent synthase, Catalytic domain n=1 Tax=Pseudonocardia thermophila TaxID=1848 RepID=A0A1M6QHV8_PSETH|nr:methionine synthase [Pseudonocardia thermophila]SHK19745.1 Cobalamin-independent synthase, Catalytic domain [Pseudonocardia thermophila]
MPDPDDLIAKALAEAGLPTEVPGAEEDDPLARAFAAAGLKLPDTEPEPEPDPDEEVEKALADVQKRGPAVVAERAPEDDGAVEVPRWPAGTATAVGSMPGTDPREAAAIVAGELPGMPALPELPARGAGSDMIGRTGALLVDLPLELKAGRWTVASRPGKDRRRAIDVLRGDMDAFDEACDPVRPEFVKIAVAGPWTLAAAVELRTGHRVITDRGAVREFAQSLTEGLRQHVAEVAARREAAVVVQLDEPALPAVLAGTLPTPSKLGTVDAVPEPEVADLLREVVGVLTGIGSPVVVHCCAEDAPLTLLRDTGATALGIDATLPSLSGPTATVAALDAVGEVWDAGVPLLLGIVPNVDPRKPVTSRKLAERAFELADRLGFARERLAELAVPTPSCGLAGADPAWAKQALQLCREIGEGFVDPPEGDADEVDGEK